MRDGFPRKLVLWSGAILGGIVNAVMTAKSSSLAYAQHWSGHKYGLNGADGREGIITFEGGSDCAGRLVGVFFDVHSARKLIRPEEEEHILARFFAGCPLFQRSLAEQKALPFLRLEIEGKIYTRLTAVFWDEGEYLTAAEPWRGVLSNGADLVENETIADLDTALLAWQDAYGMSAEQVTFIRSLFERKMARPAATIELSDPEVKWLESTFEDPRQAYLDVARLKKEKTGKDIDLKWLDSLDAKAEFQKAMDLCREKLAAIGIIVP